MCINPAGPLLIHDNPTLQGSYKSALVRALWSLFTLLMLFLFKYLLCQKLNGDVALDYSEVMSPIFILLQLVMVRACQLH